MKKETDKVAYTAGLPMEERLDALRELFPEAFTEGLLDCAKLRQSIGDLADDSPERYGFTWAGKRDAIRLLQMPSRATLEPVPDESVDWDTTSNIFIEGDNLEVLKLMLKPYNGRVKAIYIDPPYNTGHDFVYPDDYSDPLDIYLQLSGQKDAEGNLLTTNTDASGRFHSAWLSMMYPRLFLSRQLLSDDGLIFVSIDENESHNLRLVLNEIYGESNFVAQIAWKNVYGGGSKSKHIVPQHESIFCYARNKENLGVIELPPKPESRKRYTEKDSKYPTRGPFFTQPLATTSMDERPNLRFPILHDGEEIWPEKQWQWSKERVCKALDNDEIVIKKTENGWSVRYKQYLRDEDGKERGSKLFSILNGPWSQEGTAEIVELLGNGKVFAYPKPSSLIRHLISFAWQEHNPIVLDFFAGSGSTAQAIMELNRELGSTVRFVLVQLPELTPDYSEAHKAGFSAISDIGKERIRRVIEKMKESDEGQLELAETEDLGFRVYRLAESNYKQWTGIEDKDAEKYAEQLEAFADPLNETWKPENVICEVAIKEGYGLGMTVEPVDSITSNKVFRVTDHDKGQSFEICLDDTLDHMTPAALGLGENDLFVCRDIALTDMQAANLALQCRLKTV